MDLKDGNIPFQIFLFFTNITPLSRNIGLPIWIDSVADCLS